MDPTSNLTEREEYKIEVIPPFKILQCRKSIIVERDGEEIARTYERSAYLPGQDVSAACQDVQDLAAVLWTPEIIIAYSDHANSITAQSQP